MTGRWANATPENRRGEWLVSDDDDALVSEGFSLEGDAAYVGWTLRLEAVDGVPLPVIQKVLAAGTAALLEMLRTFDDGEGFTFDASD